eukprot:jgi/Phyca11/21868/fgenesh1_pg.PHYCAscaffold_170_\
MRLSHVIIAVEVALLAGSNGVAGTGTVDCPEGPGSSSASWFPSFSFNWNTSGSQTPGTPGTVTDRHCRMALLVSFDHSTPVDTGGSSAEQQIPTAPTVPKTPAAETPASPDEPEVPAAETSPENPAAQTEVTDAPAAETTDTPTNPAAQTEVTDTPATPATDAPKTPALEPTSAPETPGVQPTTAPETPTVKPTSAPEAPATDAPSTSDSSGASTPSAATNSSTSTTTADNSKLCAKPRVEITQVDLGVAVDANEDEVNLKVVAIAALPSGGSRIAFHSGDNVIVQELDASDKLVSGSTVKVPLHDFADIYADEKGFVILGTRDAEGGGTLNCGNPSNLCGAAPSPAVPCYDMYMVRYDGTKESWATKLTSSSSSLPPYSTAVFSARR